MADHFVSGTFVGRALAVTTLVGAWALSGFAAAASDAGPIFVDAGSCRSAWMFRPVVELSPHVTGAGAGVRYQWSQTLGPGRVTFSQPQSLVSAATFSTAGVYELKLTATDATGPHSDLLTVEVYDQNQPFPFCFGKPTFKQDFGYTHEQLEKYFTSDLAIQYDLTGLDLGHLRPPPPPGIHPRVLINADEKPDLLRRLNETQVGRKEMTVIRQMLLKNLTGPTAMHATIYSALAQGDSASFFGMKDRRYFTAEVTYELFRAWVEDDQPAGSKAAAALASMCKVFDADIHKRNTKDFRDNNSEIIGHQFLGYAYDFGYGFLTEPQRDIVRATLADATAGQWCIGMDALPAMHANTSNWVVNNTLYLLIDTLAIEGERGCDPSVVPRLRAALERFYTMGVGEDGALYEGMGKGQINAEALIALGKRGKLLIAASAKRHVRDFYLQCMETTGYGFTWDELLGSSNGESKYADVPTLKYAFPNDPVIDFVYRNDLGKDLSRHVGLNMVNMGFIYQTPDNLVRALFAEDFDESKTWEQAAAALNGTVPKSEFFNSRGLMVARTDWNADGTRLMFQPRTQPGGHSVPDRNTFMFSALGKIWVPYYASHVPDDIVASSVILVDGVGPSIIAARAAEYFDSPNLTYAVGDARNSYSKIPAAAGHGTLQDYTYNQARLQRGPEPWGDMAWGDLADWYLSNHTPAFWKDHTPVLRAFRTAALIRGPRPYALVMDDIQKDGDTHHYTWRMLLGEKLKVDIRGTDVILSSTDSDARLLVRLVSSSSPTAWTVTDLHWTDPFGRPAHHPALDASADCVSPAFTVLLMPCGQGESMPKTRFADGTLTLSTDDQTDRFTFTPEADGHNKLSLTRGAAARP
jgi:hypothetical protein